MPANAHKHANESGDTAEPLVSCLMVTADRKQLMRRSVHCFMTQNYTNRQLVVVDDGKEDLSDVLQEVPVNQLKYIRLEDGGDATLGELRNLSLKEADGDFLVQWDDDDWYHPDRIGIQSEVLQKGHDACCLSGALMHLDTEKFVHHPYVGYLPDGIPGSIMHRKDGQIQYPETRRAEDTVFLDKWMEKRYYKLPEEYSYLFLRAYHGDNTWEKEHFVRRIRNNPVSFIQYLWYAKLRGDLFQHPKFDLTEKEKEAFEMYLEDSRRFGLI